MKRARCRILASRKNTAIHRQLNSAGQLVFDEYYISKEAYVLILTTAEIELLEQHEVKIERVQRYDETALPPKKLLRRSVSGDDSDDTLSTGFVTAYMDAAEGATRIASLAAEFPSICQLANLPQTTSGYDGTNAVLIGSANE